MIFLDHKRRLYRDFRGALSGSVFSCEMTAGFGASGESSVCSSSHCTRFSVYRDSAGAVSISATST